MLTVFRNPLFLGTPLLTLQTRGRGHCAGRAAAVSEDRIICDLKCTDVAYTHHCCPTVVLLELFYTRPEVFFGETNAQNLVHQGYFVIMKSVKKEVLSPI